MLLDRDTCTLDAVDFSSLHKQLNFIRSRNIKFNGERCEELYSINKECLQDFTEEGSDLIKESYSFLKKYGGILDKCIYKDVLGIFCSTHLCLDKCGLTVLSNQYVTVLDFSTALDYVLHNLCGCDVKNIRSMPNYFKISKAVLGLDVESLKSLGSFSVFLGLDDKLDKYLAEQLKTKEFVRFFYWDLCRELNRILLYYTFLIKTEFSRKGTVILGYDISSSVVRSESPLDCEVLIDGYYSMKVRSYKGLDYLRSFNSCDIFSLKSEEDEFISEGILGSGDTSLISDLGLKDLDIELELDIDKGVVS